MFFWVARMYAYSQHYTSVQKLSINKIWENILLMMCQNRKNIDKINLVYVV